MTSIFWSESKFKEKGGRDRGTRLRLPRGRESVPHFQDHLTRLRLCRK